MQPVIHKARILLDATSKVPCVAPGDPAHLIIDADFSISVWCKRPAKFKFGFGRPKLSRIGVLEGYESQLIRPALEKNAEMRVRFVEVEPPHINKHGRTTIYISVWGNKADFRGESPVVQIFSHSRINDPVSRIKVKG